MATPISPPLKSAHPGIKPAQQGRSKQRQSDLIEAGIKLMCKKSIDDISILELTGFCGYSVGTFYSRFDDKESFFFAVQHAAAVKIMSLIKDGFSDAEWRQASVEQIFANLVTLSVDALKGDLRGVIRESVLRSGANKGIWRPLRACGRFIARVILDLLSPYFREGTASESRKSVQFGLQMFYGTLAQVVVNNAGPVKLEDPALKDGLTRMLTQYAALA
ncbi:MAG: TetR/AcrR family transcriptional regulator [Sneathiella sp.]